MVVSLLSDSHPEDSGGKNGCSASFSQRDIHPWILEESTHPFIPSLATSCFSMISKVGS